MIDGSCHCGALGWRFTAPLASATACNCTVCRRYGALWAYAHEGNGATLTGASRSYAHGRAIDFHFCPTCGCLVAYRDRLPRGDGQRWLVVNLRMATDPAAIADLPIDHFDGLDSFEDLPRDHRRVRDLWF
ncbi:GFA family protein [Frigidibacter sp. MR17.14]|uniref:GFA family protein n=1 Tax=Frigidibacter sp. MR17.14 TaxID=3126509 RepID=UPI003013001E